MAESIVSRPADLMVENPGTLRLKCGGALGRWTVLYKSAAYLSGRAGQRGHQPLGEATCTVQTAIDHGSNAILG